MTQVPHIEAHLTATSRQELHLSKTSLLCKLFVPNSDARCSYAPSTLHMKPQKPNFVLIVFFFLKEYLQLFALAVKHQILSNFTTHTNTHSHLHTVSACYTCTLTSSLSMLQ